MARSGAIRIRSSSRRARRAASTGATPHGHSGYAEGIGTIDFFMTFARDDARLDFVTHSEHDVWLDDAEWELSRNAVQAFDEPGRFIPYLGWEWTRHARFGGHHNVLLRDAEGKDRVSALEYPTLSELYQGLHARYDPADVLVIPHAHNPGDYRQSDPQLEPLIEMMSMHGTFEWFVRRLPVARPPGRAGGGVGRSPVAPRLLRPEPELAGAARRPRRGAGAREVPRRDLRCDEGAVDLRHDRRPHYPRRNPSTVPGWVSAGTTRRPAPSRGG